MGMGPRALEQIIVIKNRHTNKDAIAGNGSTTLKATQTTDAPKKIKTTRASVEGIQPKYPRHSVDKVLRIPRGILEQNAGKDCTDREVAKFVGVGFGGPIKVEISSALKYGFLERPSSGRVRVTELARKVLRPQQPDDEIYGLRQAVLPAPQFSDVYNHYRGENLPDRAFFENALTDKFGVPKKNYQSSSTFSWPHSRRQD